MNEEQWLFAGLAGGQAGKYFKPADVLGCYHGSLRLVPWLNAGFRALGEYMLKWILTLVVAIFLLGLITPHLARFIRFGQLPGDVSFRWRGRIYHFPFVTIIILSLLLWFIARLI